MPSLTKSQTNFWILKKDFSLPFSSEVSSVWKERGLQKCTAIASPLLLTKLLPDKGLNLSAHQVLESLQNFWWVSNARFSLPNTEIIYKSIKHKYPHTLQTTHTHTHPTIHRCRIQGKLHFEVSLVYLVYFKKWVFFSLKHWLNTT